MVMGNIYDPNVSMNQAFDLKGSFKGRTSADTDFVKKDLGTIFNLTLKIDWINFNRKITVNILKKKSFLDIHKRDLNFLTQINSFDYSILIGIEKYDSNRGIDSIKNTNKNLDLIYMKKSTHNIGSNDKNKSYIEMPSKNHGINNFYLLFKVSALRWFL